MSEEQYLQMISVKLGSKGSFEITMTPDRERLVVLEHTDQDPPVRKVCDIPMQLLPCVEAFVSTYVVEDFPLDIHPPKLPKDGYGPRTAHEVLRKAPDEPVEVTALRHGLAVEELKGLPVDQVSVERRSRSDGKVDTIVTPVGLEAGASGGSVDS